MRLPLPDAGIDPIASVRAVDGPRCPAILIEGFPGYAPELNPDEFVWAHFKARLANGRPDNLYELMTTRCKITGDVCKQPALIRSFITDSDLPSFL